MKQQITVLGAGAWGCAIAHLLATNGHRVTLWCHEPELADEINIQKTNSLFLPGIQLPHNIFATPSLQEALDGASLIFEAVPVSFLRTVLQHAKEFAHPDTVWAILSKGIEQKTLKFPSQILDDILGYKVKKVVIGGPTFARELVNGVVSATTVASDDQARAQLVANILNNDYFKTYLSDDMLGVQAGGALKNVIALTIGIALGSGAGDNTIALLLTQGLQEIGQLTQFFGGKPQTVYGLSGFGDLILTCNGSLSKNLNVGKLLGQGNLLARISSQGVLPEGINTVQSVYQILLDQKINAPLMMGTYQFIFEQLSFSVVLAAL